MVSVPYFGDLEPAMVGSSKGTITKAIPAILSDSKVKLDCF